MRYDDPDDWENVVLALFKETYPLYPQEPLLLLIKSGVFITKDDDDNDEYSAENCWFKLSLFVLLASTTDHKEFFDSWSKCFGSKSININWAVEII